MLNMKIFRSLKLSKSQFSYLSREDHDVKCPEDIHVNNANKVCCEVYSLQLHPSIISTLTKTVIIIMNLRVIGLENS